MTTHVLDSTAAVDAFIASETPVWVFKHSQTCGVSFAAHEQVEAYLADRPDDQLGMVIVQTQRPVSNYLAEKLGHVHKSPQLFLVRAGTVLWAASHYSITREAMVEARAEAAV